MGRPDAFVLRGHLPGRPDADDRASWPSCCSGMAPRRRADPKVIAPIRHGNPSTHEASPLDRFVASRWLHVRPGCSRSASRRGRAHGRAPRAAARGAGRVRAGRPGPDDRAGRRRARGGQPGGDRLGRGRPAVRRRDARLSDRDDIGPDPDAGGPRRRRPLRARDRLRRRAAVPERRAAVLRRRARDRGAEHLVPAGQRRRRPRRREAGRADRLRRGEHAAPGQRPLRGAWTTGSTSPTAGATARCGRRRSARPGGLDPPPRRPVPTLRALSSRVRSRWRRSSVEPIAGFSQFGLPHDDWGNRFPSWNTIPIRHVVLEQQALDRNPYLAETSSVASILDLADGGRIFAISPPQAAVQPRIGRVLQRQLRAGRSSAVACCRRPTTATPSSASR